MQAPTRSAAASKFLPTLCVLALGLVSCASPDDGTESSSLPAPPSSVEDADSGSYDEGDTSLSGENSADDSASEGGQDDTTPGGGESGGEDRSGARDSSAEWGPPLSEYEPPAELVAGERLLIQASDGQLVISDLDRAKEFELRSGGQGPAPRQPTWSPDGRFVAWAEVGASGGADLVVSTSDGSARRSFPVATIPFFMSWQPATDGTLTLLGNAGIELSLDQLNVFDEPDSPVTIVEGGPIFTSWERMGDRLAVHVDAGDVGIITPTTGVASDELISGGPGFNAPVWLDSGQVAVVAPTSAAPGAGTEAITLVSVDSPNLDQPDQSTPLASAPAGAWMVAEAGHESMLVQPPLRLAVNREPEAQQVGLRSEAGRIDGVQGVREEAPRIEELDFNLSRLDLVTGELDDVLDEAAVAFFPSPAARHTLAFLSPRAPDRISPEWIVVDAQGDALVRFPLIPSEHFVNNYLPFFDQYAQTTSYWSTDGANVVVVGAEPDGVSGVWVVGIDGTSVRLRDGISASWRPGSVPAPEAGATGVV